MMLLSKDIAADAVESSSAAALAIAAADRIPCGRDAVAAADAAESSDEYSAASTAIFCRSNASLRFCFVKAADAATSCQISLGNAAAAAAALPCSGTGTC